MSDPLKFALIAEGTTEREVIEASLKAILAPRSFVLTQLQPEATQPDMGTGWGGVLKWCYQLAARTDCGGGKIEDDPTLSIFDGILVQLDGDVARFSYSDLRPPIEDDKAEERGWLPLPCETPCPPKIVQQDELFSVLLSWLMPAIPGDKTVICIPAMNTGSWHAAAKLPQDHKLLAKLECCFNIETQLQQLPLELRVDKKKRQSRLNAAVAVTTNWASVIARCSRAKEFDEAIRRAFP